MSITCKYQFNIFNFQYDYKINELRVKKLLALKLFEDKITGKRWQKNVKDSNYEILCVSQFSLYNKLKGNSLEFHQAMQGDEAKEFYYSFLKKLSQNYCEEKIKGTF